MKKILLIIVVFLAVGAGVAYFFWQDIFQYSAEAVIKNNLPSYVSVGRVIFDFKAGKVNVLDLAIKNPPGYNNRFLAQIQNITCAFRMQGKTILDGIEVTEIRADRGIITIERLSNGRVNVTEMDKVMNPEGKSPGAVETPAAPREDTGKTASAKASSVKAPEIDIAKLLKLTDTINIRDGKVVFVDRAVKPSPYMLTFEDVTTDLKIGLNADYTEVLSVYSEGNGAVGGDKGQKVRWIISLDPRTPELTMSNRFEITGVDIMPFKPYYDEFSPVDIKRGRFSGTLVADLDNGNIGSTNTVRLEGLVFEEKKDQGASRFWDVPVNDLVRYFESSPGTITFDFKVKGDMENPRFYPGPLTKQAMQNMAIDTITNLLKQPEQEGAQTGGAPAAGQEAPRSDTEKIVDVIKSFMKEQ